MDGGERSPDHLHEVLSGEIRHLRELVDARDEEIDRRLEALNHAAERAVQVAAVSVTRDVFDGYKADQDAKISALRDQVLAEAASRSSRAAVISSVSTVVLLVVGWVVMWLLQ